MVVANTGLKVHDFLYFPLPFQDLEESRLSSRVLKNLSAPNFAKFQYFLGLSEV